MNSGHNRQDQGEDDPGASSEESTPPWACALRDLYQQVVEEPLPDALAALIARLDGEGP